MDSSAGSIDRASAICCSSIGAARSGAPPELPIAPARHCADEGRGGSILRASRRARRT